MKKWRESPGQPEELVRGIVMNNGAPDEVAQNLRNLYQEAPVPYFRVRIDGRIDDCNKMAEQLSGYSKQEVHGRHMKELFAQLPESRGKSKAIFDRILQDDIVQDEQVQMVKKNGSSIRASLSSKAIRNSEGKTIKVLLMIRDL